MPKLNPIKKSFHVEALDCKVTMKIKHGKTNHHGKLEKAHIFLHLKGEKGTVKVKIKDKKIKKIETKHGSKEFKQFVKVNEKLIKKTMKAELLNKKA